MISRNTFRVFILFLLIILFTYNCKPKTKEEIKKSIEERFIETVKSNQYIPSGNLLLHSNSLGIHWKYAQSNQKPISVDQPFHIASVGKMFTGVLIFQLIQAGKFTLQDKVHKYLSKEILDGLFVYNGKDYSEEVTIEQLLSHTSGIADYEKKEANSLMLTLLKEPEHFWTPLEILEYTRKNQKAVGKPNEKFYYSDTGYILLGLLIEKITGKSFEENLSNQIFKPLGMSNTYLHLRSLPESKTNLEISKIIFLKQDVTNYKSLSLDWAGGGAISNLEDLLKFSQALVEGKLIPKEIYESMKGNNKFHEGIYYGKGLMKVVLGDIFFLMKGTPELYGHSGILATQVFYCPEYDLHIILNLSSNEALEDSFKLLFFILKDIKEIQTLTNS
jgi:D-alanyl-D-alanine carboxypeptidase